MNFRLRRGNQHLFSIEKQVLACYEKAGNPISCVIFCVGYLKRIGEDWYAAARTDICFGGSTFAWFSPLAKGCGFSELFFLALNYKILSLDYESGLAVEYFKFDAATLYVN